MVYDKARELAKLLGTSEEYKEYKKTQAKAYENETTKALLKDYHKMQLEAQAGVISGKKDDETMQKLQKIGELLQMNADASMYLIAEYQLHAMLGDVYKILGDAIDLDLGALEA
ncbi:MAG: YlbF family regulator [Clostridia bacterium]